MMFSVLNIQPSCADVCFLFDFSVCNQLNIINFTVNDVGSVPVLPY